MKLYGSPSSWIRADAYRRTDRQTDRQTDGQKDAPKLRDACKRPQKWIVDECVVVCVDCFDLCQDKSK